MSSNKHLEVIKNNDLFKGIDLNSINFSFENKRLVELKEGDIIYSSGQPSDSIYLILDGEVKLKLTTLKRLFYKSGGEFVGEREIISGVERDSSALANSNCTLYKIDADFIKQLIEKSVDMRARLNFDGESAEAKAETDVFVPETIKDKTTPLLPIEPQKFDLNQFSDIESISKPVVDIDNLKVSHYEQEPDLDEVIQQKYIRSDNKSLKTQLLDDPDDLSNWVITESDIDKASTSQKQPILDNEKIEVDEIITAHPQNKLEATTPETTSNKPSNGFPVDSGDLNLNAKHIIEFLLNKTYSQVGALYLLSSDKQHLEEIYQTSESIYKGKKSVKDGITGIVAREKKIKFSASFQKDLNFDSEIDLPNEFSGETIIFIPFTDEQNELTAIAQLGTNETVFTKTEENELKDYAVKLAGLLKPGQKPIQKSSVKVSSTTDISHFAKFLLQDVKAPLLTVKHYSSILSRFDLSEEVKKVITLLSAQTSTVIDLIQGSIDYFEKNTKVKSETISFNEFLDQSLTVLSDYVESRNVKLFKKLGADARVKIDARKFYVACFYISKFACDIMKNGGNIYFSSEVNDNIVQLSIKDENKVIKETDLINLFDSNLQNDNSENIGLSLSMAKFIIESMKADIKLHFNSPGLVYQISIPVSS